MFELAAIAIKTISFAAPILLIMFTGMFVSEILLEVGLMKRFEKAGKIVNLANLPEACGIAFITAIGSPTAANAMLQNLRENKVLTDRETLLASLLNSTVVPVKETFTYHLPVVLPALGLYVGAIYIGTLWLGTSALLFFVIACGKILLRNGNTAANAIGNANVGEVILGKSITNAAKKSAKRFGRIGLTFLAATFGVFMLMNLGLIEKIEEYVIPFAQPLNVPSIVLPSIAAYIASPLVGISMVGSLIHTGAITERDAIVSLLFGSILMLPVLYLRFYFPQWISIFGLRLGVLRGLTSMSLIMLTRVIILLVFLDIS